MEFARAEHSEVFYNKAWISHRAVHMIDYFYYLRHTSVKNMNRRFMTCMFTSLLAVFRSPSQATGK